MDARLPGRGDHRLRPAGHAREHGVEERPVHDLDPARRQVAGQLRARSWIASAIVRRPCGPW